MALIPFNKPVVLPGQLDSLGKALSSGHLSGMGPFTMKCERWLDSYNQASNLIVSSATHALEMMALLLDLKSGDEVILPSFTFVSTANAFAIRGVTLRFADNDAYGNLLLSEVERLLNSKTKAVVAVHYGGNSCEMDLLRGICDRAGVALLEDAAQAIGSKFRGKHLGTLGQMGCYSFHETKNVSAGEGGALILAPSSPLLDRAQIIREKGTNRRRFLNGQTDKYTWVDIGSSYVLSDLNCAYLYPQLESFRAIQTKRIQIWKNYRDAIEGKIAKVDGRILGTPEWNEPNGHLFCLVLPNRSLRDHFIASMAKEEVQCPFHYIPLHNAPFMTGGPGRVEALPQCEKLSDGLVRLPLFFSLTVEEQNKIIQKVLKWIELQ